MWQEIDNQLYRKFTFDNFIEAFGFMTRAAILVEKVNHHPTWKNTWNVVEIWLTTHDKGNTITEKDIDLSKRIDSLLQA